MRKLFIILVLLLPLTYLCVSSKIIQDDLEDPVIIIEKNSPIQNEYLGEFTATHYTHTGNTCSTGVYPKAGRTVAVDPKKIPYGTYLYVEGYGVLIAEDCGGDIKGRRIDIFVDTHKEAIQLGKRKVRVWKIIKT